LYYEGIICAKLRKNCGIFKNFNIEVALIRFFFAEIRSLCKQRPDMEEGEVEASASASPSEVLTIPAYLSITGLFFLAIVFLHDGDEVEHLVGVADLVVIPGDNLHEIVGQIYAGICVED